MKVAVCEDNAIELDGIVQALRSFDFITDIDGFVESEELLSSIRSNKYDIIFLDIVMPDINGIEAAKLIRQDYPDVVVIFITAYDEFGLDAFSLYATDYILKPLDTKRLEKTLSRVCKYVKPPVENKVVEIRTQNTLYKLSQDDIIMVEKQSNQCIVYTEQFSLEVLSSIKYFENILDSEIFIRSHAGFLINLKKILKVVAVGNLSYTVYFNGTDKTARLSRNNRNKLFKAGITVGD